MKMVDEVIEIGKKFKEKLLEIFSSEGFLRFADTVRQH